LSEPVRTCVACRTRRPQRALVRLRRRSDGVVVPAMGRHTRGRSAYLCPARACFEQALRRCALERALGRTGSPAADEAVALETTLDAPPSEPLAPKAKGHRSRPHRARVPTLEVLWPSVVAALDQELQNMQRTGDIGHHGPRYDAISTLRRGLSEPGRSA
jgi:predicted RNA-binding protein YlxR (DUF448 family)